VEIAKKIGHNPTDQELVEMLDWTREVRSPDYVPFGKYVVDRLDDLAGFVLMWRTHFLEVMKPQFMPDYWKVDRFPTPEEVALVKNAPPTNESRWNQGMGQQRKKHSQRYSELFGDSSLV
jgi:hypothetical protein